VTDSAGSSSALVLAAAAAGLTVWLAFRPRQLSARTRIMSTPDDRAVRAASHFSIVEDSSARVVVCAVSSVVVGGLVHGRTGMVVGLVIGLVLGRALGRLEPPSVVREREQVARDLPLAVDLRAACTRAGLPLVAVLPAVARAVGGPLQERLELVRARWELGADPVQEWQRLAADPVLADLGMALVRAHRTGAPLVDTLERVARDARRRRRAIALARARSASVAAAAPLAVCFLPAFMLVGVVPTVVGGFMHVL
jgi:Flp pilus assembly protein TadB